MGWAGWLAGWLARLRAVLGGAAGGNESCQPGRVAGLGGLNKAGWLAGGLDWVGLAGLAPSGPPKQDEFLIGL